jgi:hypothetical protein
MGQARAIQHPVKEPNVAYGVVHHKTHPTSVWEPSDAVTGCTITGCVAQRAPAAAGAATVGVVITIH